MQSDKVAAGDTAGLTEMLEGAGETCIDSLAIVHTGGQVGRFKSQEGGCRSARSRQQHTREDIR